MVVEVLSHSTEAYDRGDKLEHYKRLASLLHCVLVHHAKRELWVHSRDEQGVWSVRQLGPGERAELSQIACSVDVDELYDAAGVLI